jgi:cell division protein FtsA
VIKPLASALGAITPEEAMAGVIAVDIGGGTCGVAVFADGRPKHLAVLPVGGDHITNDVADVLKIPIGKAEEVKKEADIYADQAANGVDSQEFDHNGRNYSYSSSKMTDIVQCRLEELFASLIKGEVANSGISMLPAGIVLTGGVSRSTGIEQYLTNLMDMPVRSAFPIDSNRMPPGRNGPEYTCASGIIRYALEQERDPFRYIEQPLDQILKPAIKRPQGMASGQGAEQEAKGPSILESIKSVIKELF